MLPNEVSVERVAEALEAFMPYPNPAIDEVVIDLGKLGTKQPIRIVLLEMNGQPVMDKTLAAMPVEGLTLDVSKLKDGLYVLQLIVDGQHSTRQIAIGAKRF